jgi:PPM family protein phosphatase
MIESSMFENVSHGEKSDIGLHRHNNEDHFLIVDQFRNDCDLRRLGLLFVIADGMGGHAAGEIASRIACEETISAYYRDDTLFQSDSAADEPGIMQLEKAVWSAHRKIVEVAGRKEEWRGMGTTLSALALVDDAALIAHVGDSRIYRCRGGSFERMTVDHTKNQYLINKGQILAGDESDLFGSHILTRALGGYGDLEEVFTRVEKVRSGDRFLLCTDGLHGHLTDDEILRILINHPVPETVCDELVQAAIVKGGHDNVTVIAVQV